MKQDNRKRVPAFIKSGTILVMVLMVSGCSSFFKNIDDTISRKKHKNGFHILEQGRVSLLEGNYEKAFELYKTLSHTTASKNIAARAGFGEACARLHMAKTQDQYKDAIILWRHQVQSNKKYLVGEDIELVESALSCFQVSVQEETAPPDVDCSHEVERARRQLLEKEKQIQNLEERLALETRKVNSLSAFKKIQSRTEQEIEALKAKITALETLDQKIQKKKTEISSPE